MKEKVPVLVNEPNRVIMYGDTDSWAGEIVCDVTYSGTENIDLFNESFEIVKGDHQAGVDYYQGLDFMALIRRKSDGRLFGYPYWMPLAKNADWDVTPNGGDYDLDEESWVWLPVATSTVTIYQIADSPEGN